MGVVDLCVHWLRCICCKRYSMFASVFLVFHPRHWNLCLQWLSSSELLGCASLVPVGVFFCVFSGTLVNRIGMGELDCASSITVHIWLLGRHAISSARVSVICYLSGIWIAQLLWCTLGLHV